MTSIVRAVWNVSFGRLENQYEKELSRVVDASCVSLLDVGCGFNSPVSSLRQRPKYMVGIDGFAPAIEESRAKGIHEEYHRMPLLEIGNKFKPESFDCILASDVIEHFTKEEGISLIEQMERIARKKVIIYTPNGFLPQGEEYGNPMQRHLSGWTAREMERLGYRIVGIQGFRCLRGEMARIKWRPYRFWYMVSLLSQFITKNHPAWAFRILCVKEKG